MEYNVVVTGVLTSIFLTTNYMHVFSRVMGSFIYFFLSVKIFYPSLNDFGIDLEVQRLSIYLTDGCFQDTCPLLQTEQALPAKLWLPVHFLYWVLREAKTLILKNSPTCFSSVMVFISVAHKICAYAKTDDKMYQVPEVSVFKKL